MRESRPCGSVRAEGSNVLGYSETPGESSENITNAFRTLLVCVSEVKGSIPKCSNSNKGSSSHCSSSNLNNSNSQSPNDDYLLTSDQIDKLQKDFPEIKKAFSNFNELVEKNFECSLDNFFNTPGQDPWANQIRVKLSALQNLVMKLRFHIPSLRTELSSTTSDVRRYTWKEWSNSVVDDKSPNSHMNDEILQRSDLTELEEAFKELNIKLKLCLLCFAVVPENAVVKRRLLIDWWIGERLLDSPAPEGMAAEELADEILMELIAEGFIERVKRRQKLITDRFKMQPVVRSLVIKVAEEEGFLDYNFKGNSTPSSLACSRFCLPYAKDKASEQVLPGSPNFDLEKLQTVFNINEPFPDLELKSFSKANHLNIVDCFSKMKNVNVLYLGRWQSSGEHHIEVETINFLKGLKNMKCLRLLSLQGISRINELPKSVGKLTNLRILDLKACHNLEALPAEIALLKQLTRLDISECFLLDGMPKGIASLSKLEVLKGFLIDNLESESSCTLESLIGLEKLRNLSINTSRRAFPTEKELHALSKLEALQKLGIAWGMKQQNGAPKPTRASSKHIRGGELELPTKLEKLKLQCLPHRITPWLIPGKLKSLKKLFIRGGELDNLGGGEW